MNNQPITSRIIKTALIKWEQLQFSQQENFKEWIAEGDIKLTESILKYQFIDPFKVWEHDGNIYCLDGKHRSLDLLRVRELGYEVPWFRYCTYSLRAYQTQRKVYRD